MELDRAVLLTVVVVLLALSVWLVLPYMQYVLAAVLIAFVLQPLQARLSARIGETPSAIVLVTGSVLAVVLPVILILAYVASDVLAWAETLQEQGFDAGPIEDLIAEYTGRDVDVASAASSAVETASEGFLGSALTVFETVSGLVVGLALLAFLLYFMVKNGHAFSTWLDQVSPMPPRVTEDLVDGVTGITRAVLAGHVLVAIVQGVLAGMGLYVVGIPNAVFWTFVMVLLALIPVVGAFVVWGPAVIYLLLQGQVPQAIGLAVWGTIAVGVSDDYLRPVIVDRYAQVSPSVVLIGVVGGISTMGFVGLFVGPIVLGALKESIEIYARHYGRVASPSE